MAGQRLTMHGRDHRTGGADPIPGQECVIHFGNNTPGSNCSDFLSIDFFTDTDSSFNFRGGTFVLQTTRPRATGPLDPFSGLQILVASGGTSQDIVLWDQPTTGYGTILIRGDSPGRGRDTGVSPQREAGAIILQANTSPGGTDRDMISLSAKGSHGSIGLYTYDNTVVGGGLGSITIKNGTGPLEISSGGPLNIGTSDEIHLSAGSLSSIYANVMEAGYDGSIQVRIGGDSVTSFGAVKFWIESDNSFAAGFERLFEVRNDGTVHIKTGQTILADLP